MPLVKADVGLVFPDTPSTTYDGLTASATISPAGTVVEVTGSGTVGPAGAASTAVCGIAVAAAASGAPVRVFMPGGVWSSTASGSITAGQKLAAAASGQVANIAAGTFQQQIGVALTTASGGAAVLWTMQ